MNMNTASSILDKLPPMFMRTSPHSYPLPFADSLIGYYPVLNKLFGSCLVNIGQIQHNLTRLRLQGQRLDLASQGDVTGAISALDTVHFNLCIFLSELYKAAEKLTIPANGNEAPSVEAMFLTINQSFLNLEESLAVQQSTSLASLTAESFHHISEDDDELTQNGNTRFLLDSVTQNGGRLNRYLATVLSKYGVTKRTTRPWIVLGALGVSLFSIWLLRQRYNSSSSNDESHETSEKLVNLYVDYFKTPLKAIKHELFKTKTKVEDEPAALKKARLHLRSMLLEYSGKEYAENDEMYEDAMDSLREQFEHPLRALWDGRLLKGLVIKMQRLFVDVEIGKHVVKTMFTNTGLYMALWSAFPGLLMLCVGTYLLRRCLALYQDANEINRNKCRLILEEAELRVRDYLDNKDNKDLGYLHGLHLCTLNEFYQKIEKYARFSGEWTSLERLLLGLGTSDREDEAAELKVNRVHRLQVFYTCTRQSPNPSPGPNPSHPLKSGLAILL